MSEPRGTVGAEGPDDPGSPDGRLCPECGAPRAADNTPSCGCGRRVSEALRDARTAEAAAAEDFDPLRIRPYVELEGGAEPADGAGETMPLRAVPPTDPAPAPAPTEPSSTLPAPLPPPTPTPTPTPTPSERDGAGRRRRTVLLGVGGGLVAVLAAAGLASGLLAYETPSRDRALPEDVRVSVPDPPSSEAARTPSPTGTSPRPAPPPVPPSPTRSASLSPSPSRSSASPTPPPSTEPANTPSGTGAADAQEESSAARETAPPTLRRGDRGPEVTELELRLTQLGLYTREAAGTYNEGVEDAVTRYQRARGIQPEEYGVYDLATRERLESETREP
ncbi:peptidoglycan-binding domain-containing protein [Streptomyces sp. NPDC006385]|uniref:peptidoglycan-binding domain-containing protein n=1 Tax=Streptomyces sp. NPDC006385 TaxID=3156761 RepID=UPI00339DB465